MELISNDKMLGENVELVKRGIDFIIRALADVKCEIKPDWGNSSLTRALRTLRERIEFIEQKYTAVLWDLQKMEGLYPAEKRGNIQAKVKTVGSALKALEDTHKILDNLKSTLEGMPVKLFN